jgi:hypothetical protein
MARRSGGAFIGCLAALCLLILGVGGGAWWFRGHILDEASAQLSAQGATWTSVRDSRFGRTWHEVQIQGVDAKAIKLELLKGPRVTVVEPRVELTNLSFPKLSSPAEMAIPAAVGLADRLKPTVVVHGAMVTWKGDTILDELSGPIFPEFELLGAGGGAYRDAAGWTLELDRELKLGPLDATTIAHVRIPREGSGISFQLKAPDAIIAHPLLARAPLPPAPLDVTGEWDHAQGLFAVRWRMGQVDGVLRGVWTPGAETWRVVIDLPDTDLASILRLFGAQVPEARTATVEGTLGLIATLRAPEMTWSLEPRVAGLATSRILAHPAQLRHGRTTWRATNAEGQSIVKTTGDLEPTWTRTRDAGWFPAAAVAAEDATFRTHPGYDIEAIQAAIEDARNQEGGPFGFTRGGSSITQQLAKNLYLDGERTLARKLRELLYTLALEAQLGKDRILELYINIIEFAPGVHGIGDGASHWFAKEPHDLTPREAAFLAAILPGPRTWTDKIRGGAKAPDWLINVILDNMVDGGELTAQAAAEEKGVELVIIPPP